MARQLASFVVVLALLATACGGDGAAGTGPSATDTASQTTSPPSEAGCTRETAIDLTDGDPFGITMSGFAFDPPCFAVSSASSIVIENEDAVPHSFTIDGTPVDIEVGGGQTVERATTGLEPGAYGFRCTFHPPTMVGTVFVS